MAGSLPAVCDSFDPPEDPRSEQCVRCGVRGPSWFLDAAGICVDCEAEANEADPWVSGFEPHPAPWGADSGGEGQGE